MKIIVYLVVAVVLGLFVMFAPLMVFSVYSYHTVITQSEIGKEFVSSRVWNNTNAASFGGNNISNQTLTFNEAAQLFGWMDAKTEPFPTSLVPAVLLVVVGFVIALGSFLFLRNKV